MHRTNKVSCPPSFTDPLVNLISFTQPISVPAFFCDTLSLVRTGNQECAHGQKFVYPFWWNDLSNPPPMKLHKRGNGCRRYTLGATSFGASDGLTHYAVNGQAVL